MSEVDGADSSEAEDVDVEDLVSKYGWHFDMLNDTERTGLYAHAIRCAVQEARRRRRTAEDHGVNVLDVGTGSGLLALCAAKSGASQVTAVELDPALCDVARGNAKANGFEADSAVACSSGPRVQVRILEQHSSTVRRTDIGNIEGHGAGKGADVVVSEVLDSGLIGEDVLSTMRHVRENLLRKPVAGTDCSEHAPIFVPASATIWGQLVECKTLQHCQHLGTEYWRGSSDGSDGGNRMGKAGPMLGVLRLPADIVACGGDANPHDVCADALYEQRQLRPLSAPFEAMKFPLDGSLLSRGRCRKLRVAASASGTIHAVLFWWRANLLDEKMAAASSISSTLDTAPMFARIGKSGEVLYQREEGDWAKQAQQVHARSRCSGLNESNCTSAGGSSRSHWRQAATVLPKPNVLAQQGQTVVVTVAHTDEDIWFRVARDPKVFVGSKRKHECMGGDGGDVVQIAGVDEGAPTFPRASDNDNRIGQMLHNACSAERMLALNDVERQKLLMHAMHTVVQRLTSSIRRQPAAKTPNQTTVLDASDGSLLALLFCTACDDDKQIQVLSLETSPAEAELWRAVLAANEPAFALTPAIRLQDDYSDAASDAVLQENIGDSDGSGEERESAEHRKHVEQPVHKDREVHGEHLKQEEYDEHDEQEGQEEECEGALSDIDHVHVLLLEPHVSGMADVWHGPSMLRLWSRRMQLSPLLDGMDHRPLICPTRARIMACVVECTAIFEQRQPIGPDIEGLDLRSLNALRGDCESDDATGYIISIPLACHAHKTLSAPFELLSVNFQDPPMADGAMDELANLSSQYCDCDGIAHGLALWVEYEMLSSETSGVDAYSENEEIMWLSVGAPGGANRRFLQPFSYQGLTLLGSKTNVKRSFSLASVASVLDLSSGSITASLVIQNVEQ